MFVCEQFFVYTKEHVLCDQFSALPLSSMELRGKLESLCKHYFMLIRKKLTGKQIQNTPQYRYTVNQHCHKRIYFHNYIDHVNKFAL